MHEAAAWPPCLALADRLLIGGVSSGPGGGEAEAGELLWCVHEALVFAPPRCSRAEGGGSGVRLKSIFVPSFDGFFEDCRK